MAILRTDIERALDELISQEEGMRFQGLAVALGKMRWRELVACERKKDLGLDAYAPATQTAERIGKGLASSITSKLKKISDDTKNAKKNFPDLRMLLFVTPAKVSNPLQKQWQAAIQKDHGIELCIISREEIIALMTVPENSALCASSLHLAADAEPQVADLIAKTRRASDTVTQAWAGKTKGHPLIDLAAVRIDSNGAESADVLSLEQIEQALAQSRRVVLEGPAGRGKTTTLIQLAQRAPTTGVPFIVDLPAWTSSRRGILQFIADMPAFQAERLSTADLARVQKTEPFLLLLNGWNEVAESNSAQANDALRELERDFPSAGIIVATRTHHLTPPLPGALRLRLMRLRRAQRAGYLAARLGARSAELSTRIEADPALDDLTRTPFILSEVASLFEAGAAIPSTKMGVLAEVLRLQEQRDEHGNALQAEPIYGLQTDYLKALATEMTRRGAVALPEEDARSVVAAAARDLADRGQIEPVGAPIVLATLTAHHVLERVDYPQTAFQFEHQQLQEYYAAVDVRARLLSLRDDDPDATGRFTADCVNNLAWAEPLRMIAETLAKPPGDAEIDRNTRAGRKLVEMALSVDPVFAGELAHLCGPAVWKEVRTAVSGRLRAIYPLYNGILRHYALAAMLATGADDFCDLIMPLLSGRDQQTQLYMYRLWPDIQVSSLGANWREEVRGWSDGSRAEFVSQLLHHQVNGEVAAFAAEDDSIAVKQAAVFGLMWTRSDEELTRVLESMDAQTFEDVARKYAGRMPAALRPRTVDALRKFVETASDQPARLLAALNLIGVGETGMDGVVKDAMAALPGRDALNQGVHYIEPALTYLCKADPEWVSEWVAIQIAEGAGPDYWLRFATAIPEGLVEKYLKRLETEDFKNAHVGGMVKVIAARGEEKLAARVFARLRELQSKIEGGPDEGHEFEWHVINQLEAVFRGLPDNVAVTGILSSVTSGDPLDIRVATELLSRVARTDMEPLQLVDQDLAERLRAYLRGSVDLVLRQNDFDGKEKANLASSIAQVGSPSDLADLVTLIRADIERSRRGRAAYAAGDRGPLGNGGIMSYARWHIATALHLGGAGVEQLLIDLLPEPEYVADAAAAMAQAFVPKPFERTLHYDVMWAARDGRTSQTGDAHTCTRFATALRAEIERLRTHTQGRSHAGRVRVISRELAAIDGHGSATLVLEVIALPAQGDHYTLLEAAERLLMAGVVLPATSVFTLVDDILERTEQWMQDSDKHLLLRLLVLCPFVDNPAAGIVKMRDVLAKRQFWGYELRGLIIALGESRLDAALDVLQELAADAQTFEQCGDDVINAIAALDTPRSRELLLGFVDPNIRGIAPTRSPHREDSLVTSLTDLARREPEVNARLRALCARDLPELNRDILSKVMSRIETPEALAASLNLIDDAKPSAVPQGIRDQLEGGFIERRPYRQSPNTFTEHARTSNALRTQLFRMVEDEKRRKSAVMLLAQIEEWRLEHGRPIDEPRHPDLACGKPWPLMGP